MPILEEQILQSQCYKWFHNTYPALRGSLFCINNNSENKVKGAINKALGVVKGVTDMCLITKNKIYFIEFKTEKGVQSKEQKAFEKISKTNCSEYIILKGFEEFKQFINEVYV